VRKKLSLITVCLNSESTIADTIISVLNQDFKDFEYIIFDGGSIDNTISIIKSFGSSISLIHGTDSGIFDAMNQAIEYATGEIVGIINSDDFYTYSGVLSRVLKEFDCTGADTVYGDLQYVYRGDASKIYRNWKSGHFSRSKFKYGWTIPHPTFFVKREVYERYGLFDKEFKISGDYELVLRFLYKHNVSTSYIPEILVKMRNNGNSDGSLLKRFESLKEDAAAWRVNGLELSFFTVPLKPLRKMNQFW
jgi:glycosyltransferase